MKKKEEKKIEEPGERGEQGGWKGDKTDDGGVGNHDTQTPCARNAGVLSGGLNGRSLDKTRLLFPLKSHVLACQTDSVCQKLTSLANVRMRAMMM